MSESYFQSFVLQKQQKEKELKDISAETKSLSRVVYKLKNEMQNLKNEVLSGFKEVKFLTVSDEGLES